MNDSFRKMQMAIVAIVMTATGYLHADCETCCSGCGEFFVEAEFLYLRAFEGGLSNVCDDTHITDTTENGTVISRLQGKAHDPDFRWNPGFRIGAGYKFADSNCGVGATWTHFNSNSRSGKNHKRQHHWKIDFDVVDLVYGCEFDWSSCFALTPYLGLKFANIEQKLRTRFVSTIQSITDKTCVRSKGHTKEEFYGVGPLLGLEADWGILDGFSLYGNVAIALLYGNFHVKTNATDNFDSTININHLKKHIQSCQTVLDTGIGVRWRTCVCCKPLVVQLGLEQHRYFNQNQFCNYGDLSVDGVSLGLGVEF